MTGQALIVQGDALHLSLPDGSVDLIVTSPPYAFLRNYDTGYPDLEIGSEPSPQQFLEALWAATAEMKRVLKPTGSIFVDLGDVYSSTSKGSGGTGKSTLSQHTDEGRLRSQQRSQSPAHRIEPGVPAKSLMLLPERYRINCVDHLGLIARAVIVWNKANSLPESVGDRVKRSHEDWIHLTKNPRYYSAIDEIREPHTMRPQRRPNGRPEDQTPRPGQPRQAWSTATRDDIGVDGHPLGKLPGSVWTIASEPLDLPGYFVTRDGTLVDFIAPTRGRPRPKLNGNGHGLFNPDAYAEVIVGEDAGAWRWLRSTGVNASPWPKAPEGLQLHTAASHYAAFPSRWPERLILGFSPPGICLDCGQGRVPVVERERTQTRTGNDAIRGPNDGSVIPQSGGNGFGQRAETTAAILGYACSCTPYTDHPASGESSGPDGRYADAIAAGAPYNPGGGLMNRPRVGPWREYHLDGWKPPPTRPAVVLDCFGGTGTTAMVARALGRIGISVDLSHAYGRAARWRVTHDGAKAISRTNLERQGELL